MKDFLSLAEQRQSDRAFDPKRTIEPEKIERILEAARLAPSACNAQPWHFIIVNDPEKKDLLADAVANKVLGFNHFTKQAPVHILIIEEKPNISSAFGGWIKDKKFTHVDIGIVSAFITLAAEDEGIGSCILGWFDEDKVKDIFNIPSSKRVLIDIVLGYSIQPDRVKKRKSIEEIVSYNTY